MGTLGGRSHDVQSAAPPVEYAPALQGNGWIEEPGQK